MKKIWNLGISSFALHVLAMVIMTMDHTWAKLLPNLRWLTTVGRMAFPIFAFMIVEGYFHTRSVKKYMLRMLAFAVISELPFNLMYSGSWSYIMHQNVMWTFLIALVMIHIIETVKNRGKLWLTILTAAAVTIAGILLGFATFVDYYGFGIMMVMTFYFFRGRKWWCYLGQLVCMFYINYEIMGGLCIFINLFGHQIEVVEQSVALLALIPIWLYRGRQGYHAKWFQYLCYGFYPAHMLILCALQALTM